MRALSNLQSQDGGVCRATGADICGLVVCCVQATILANLKDPDVSIRRRALDLMFTMCDGGAAVEVVEELVRTCCA